MKSKIPRNRLWPLYGQGFDNLGRDGQPIEAPMPGYGADELLVRHDACGLCFSDIKVIDQGQSHPRISRDMAKEPVVLGHEVAITVVGVGKKLRGQYKLGERFIVQADIYVKGVNYAYGYMIQGGLSEYGVIDQRVLNGDGGNYLLPVKAETGYVESALAEPWACAVAAYALQYRTGIKSGGTAWFIGAGGEARYALSAGFDENSRPRRIILTQVPPDFARELKQRAAILGVEVLTADELRTPPAESVDDIIVLGANAEVIEAAAGRLAAFGILAVIAPGTRASSPQAAKMAAFPAPRPIALDVGRIHYNRWLYVGGAEPDISQAYARVPVRSALKPGGRAWFVGAGGPIGRMHVQRAIQLPNGPATILCTDASALRLDDLYASFKDEASAKGIEFICLNPMQREAYTNGLANFKTDGFDDIVVLAPVAAAIEDAANYFAPRGVMNIFAGVARGTLARVDLQNVYGPKQARIIGHSASSIEDLRTVLRLVEDGQLATNRSLAAVGSLTAARDGLKAVKGNVFPGKIVIFPHIQDLPLTSLPDLRDKLPTVFALLRGGREWTKEAEDEFLKVMAK